MSDDEWVGPAEARGRLAPELPEVLAEVFFKVFRHQAKNSGDKLQMSEARAILGAVEEQGEHLLEILTHEVAVLRCKLDGKVSMCCELEEWMKKRSAGEKDA